MSSNSAKALTTSHNFSSLPPGLQACNSPPTPFSNIMEPLFTRAPFLYPPGVRSLLFAPQCLNPSTQIRFASRRIRRKGSKKKPGHNLFLEEHSSNVDQVQDNASTKSEATQVPLQNTAPTPPTVSKDATPSHTPKLITKPGRHPYFRGMWYNQSDEVLNCYWNSTAPSPENLATANEFFTSSKTSAKFLIGPERFRDIPRSTIPEVCFLGRSNVGKSSLLNAVFNDASLARTSARPGKTRTINLYGLGGVGHGGTSLKTNENQHMYIEGEGGLVLVDMPGYGFASQSGWGTEILKYLTSRKQYVPDTLLYVLLNIFNNS